MIENNKSRPDPIVALDFLESNSSLNLYLAGGSGYKKERKFA